MHYFFVVVVVVVVVVIVVVVVVVVAGMISYVWKDSQEHYWFFLKSKYLFV